MDESKLHRVLLVGATGRLGRRFVTALRERGKEVLALLRSPSRPTDEADSELVGTLTQQGVEIIDGSLEDDAAVRKACREADAVISCVDQQPERLRLQIALARAAKDSGRVRRLIPSQFGIDSRTYHEGRVAHGDTKRELQQVFDACGVPVTYVHANGFADYWAASLGQLGLREPPAREIKVFGDGNVKVAIVAPRDIASYTVRMLDDPRTANRHVTIRPAENLLTQNELIRLWEAKAGVTLERRLVSSNQLDDAIADAATKPGSDLELAFLQLIRAVWIDGLGGKRRPDVLEATELYPDVRYERVTEYLDRFVPGRA